MNKQTTSVTNKHSDLAYLRGLAKGSNTFILQMLNIYITQTPAAIERIDKTLANKDWHSLRMAIHKLKPSTMFVGLNEIIRDITLLEDYAEQESHLDEIPGMVDKIKRVCLEAIPELQDELNKLK